MKAASMEIGTSGFGKTDFYPLNPNKIPDQFIAL
jgi:hypothetical protein